MRPLRWEVAAALAACALAGIAVMAQENKSFPLLQEKKPDKAVIDKPISDFKLQDLMHEKKAGEKADAAQIALADFKDKKPVVLFFMSEQCSVTWRYEKRMGQLMEQYGKKNVAFLGVRCSANDTPQSLCKFAESKNFVMPLLNDEAGKMTAYFGVHNTPSFALIDKKGVLRYFGSFDDAPDEPDVKAHYLPDAITAVMGDKLVAVKKTTPFG
ncbi:MAG TPA: redoxin domain-containing protein [Chthonomonadaceae bacterium]|nr:redoxin domain-containing protein [Chthonomonadaceae bacterium]